MRKAAPAGRRLLSCREHHVLLCIAASVSRRRWAITAAIDRSPEGTEQSSSVEASQLACREGFAALICVKVGASAGGTCASWFVAALRAAMRARLRASRRFFRLPMEGLSGMYVSHLLCSTRPYASGQPTSFVSCSARCLRPCHRLSCRGSGCRRGRISASPRRTTPASSARTWHRGMACGRCRRCVRR